jgi:hypothetical protein
MNLFLAVPDVIGVFDVSIFYSNITSKLEPSLSSFRYFLQFGSIDLPVGIWNLCLTKSEQEKCFEINSSRVISALFSVFETGIYRIRASSSPWGGILITPDGNGNFSVTADWNFVEKVIFAPVNSRSPSLTQSIPQSRTPSISPPTETSNPTPSETDNPPPTTNDNSGQTSTTTMVILIIGVIVIIAVIGIIIFCVCRRIRRKRAEAGDPSYPDHRPLESTGKSGIAQYF